MLEEPLADIQVVRKRPQFLVVNVGKRMTMERSKPTGRVVGAIDGKPAGVDVGARL